MADQNSTVNVELLVREHALANERDAVTALRGRITDLKEEIRDRIVTIERLEAEIEIIKDAEQNAQADEIAATADSIGE